jgi:hypothetical protein
MAARRREPSGSTSAFDIITDADEKKVLIQYLLATPSLKSNEAYRAVRAELAPMLRPAGHCGAFTWDGVENAITENPLWQSSFSWIDYVLWVENNTEPPAYMDNRAIRLTSPVSYPEINLVIGKACAAAFVRNARSTVTKKEPETAVRQRILREGRLSALGFPCTPEGLGNGSLERRIRSAVPNLPKRNIWGNGLAYVFDVGTFEITTEFDSEPVYETFTWNDRIDSVLCPFFDEVSDHYGVMSWILMKEYPGLVRTTLPYADALAPVNTLQKLQTTTRTEPIPPLLSIREPKKSKGADRDAYNIHEREGLRPRISEGTFVATPFVSPLFRPKRKIQSTPKRYKLNLLDVPWPKMQIELGQRLEDDRTNSSKYIRIYTQNLHFRPYKLSITVSCNRESTANNMQEFRAVTFVNAIKNMKPWELPHILCLQETQHPEANDLLTTGLKKVYKHGVTSKNVMRPSSRPDSGYSFAVVWSGLQVWTNWDVLDSTYYRFTLFTGETARGKVRASRSSGVDSSLVNKGFLYVKLQAPASMGGQQIQVIVAHPSPYIHGRDRWKITRGLFFANAYDYNEIAETHRQQIDVIRSFIEVETDKDVPLFVTGDMNINRYAVEPDTDAEKDPVAARHCCSVEFLDTLRQLNAVAPDIVPDANPTRWVYEDREAAARAIESILARK